MKSREYSVHPGVVRGAAFVRVLPEKTGRSLEESTTFKRAYELDG